MTGTELWNKAYKRIFELYGDTPDIRIINRFLSEKQAFSQFDCITYFDIIGKLREEIREKGEILIGKSVLGSCFTAYLLGASDINPLPLHKYCPDCKHTTFIANDHTQNVSDMPYDLEGDTCKYCGEETYYEGFDIPFEIYLPYVKKGVEFNHANYKELYDEITSHITPSLCELTEKCKEMERRTGVDMDCIYRGDETVLSHFCAGDFVGFPPREAKVFHTMAEVAKPKTYGDILKLIGLGNGTQTWKHNAEELLSNGVCSLADIHATRDEVFMMIREAMRKCGFYDTGFAYDVADKACRGYDLKHGMDSYTTDMLRNLGFDEWYIDYLLRVYYMAPKALAVTELKYRIMLGWYQLQFFEEYREMENVEKI